MTAHSSTIDTPIGPFTAIVNPEGAVLASGWTASLNTLLPLIAPPLRPHDVRPHPDLGPVTKATIAYHDGDLHAPDTIEVHQSSGPFLTHAWKVLRTIPPGHPTTYTEFAALSGSPTATRAAANACARNAAALFVPCHRIIRTDGTLGGFRWGLPIKRWLLDHESRDG